MSSNLGDTNLILQFALIAVLIFINAFFAAAEMAMVSLNKNRLNLLSETGDKKAIMLKRLMGEPTRFLSTIQVGITFAGFFSSAYAATQVSTVFGVYLIGLGVPRGNEIALISITIVLSYLTLVFGELYPKRLALQNSEKIAMASIRPVVVLSKIALPFVKLLSLSTNLLTRITGMKSEGLEEKISREEIRSLVDVGQEHGVIDETEREMLDSIFRFDDKVAKEIMTPRTDVYMINLDRPYSEYTRDIVKKKYSRIPLYRGNIDNIVGILNIKDFLDEAYSVGFDKVSLEKIMRPAYFVPERKFIDDLFNELQSSNQHMSILVDEYGGFSGVVTMEDLIEEVMGEIWDEFEESNLNIRKTGKNTYQIRGVATIEDLNECLHLDLDEDSEDYDTLGGLLVHLIGYIPETSEIEVIEYRNMTFSIKEVRDNRIELVELYIAESEVYN